METFLDSRLAHGRAISKKEKKKEEKTERAKEIPTEQVKT